MVERVVDMREWLAPQLSRSLPVSNEARAYITNVLARGEMHGAALISVEAMEASLTADVDRLIRLGDWGLFKGILDPSCLRSNGRLLLMVASGSYARAFRLTRGQWPVFIEIGRQLEDISVTVHGILAQSGTRHGHAELEDAGRWAAGGAVETH